MNIAEWILVAFLSLALLIFLILAIILVAKLIGLTKTAKNIMITGQSIANKADDVVDNVKNMTSIGGVIKNFTDQCSKAKTSKKGKKVKDDEDF